MWIKRFDNNSIVVYAMMHNRIGSLWRTLAPSGECMLLIVFARLKLRSHRIQRRAAPCGILSGSLAQYKAVFAAECSVGDRAAPNPMQMLHNVVLCILFESPAHLFNLQQVSDGILHQTCSRVTKEVPVNNRKCQENITQSHTWTQKLWQDKDHWSNAFGKHLLWVSCKNDQNS